MVNGAIVAKNWKTEGGLSRVEYRQPVPSPLTLLLALPFVVFRFTQCTPRKGYLLLVRVAWWVESLLRNTYIFCCCCCWSPFSKFFKEIKSADMVRVESTILADRFGISVVVEAKLSSSLLPFQTLTLISVQNGNPCSIAFKCQICIHLFSSAAVHYDRI